MTPSNPIRVAVITGYHPFDVPAFHQVFRSFADVDCYPQNLEDFATSPDQARQWYDVLVFYNMHMEPLGEVGWQPAARHAIEMLGEAEQGVLILHHALLAWPGWQVWNDIVGIDDRSFGYHYGETVNVHVAAPGHPITQGLSDWTMLDETYTMADCSPDSEILLTTEHPKSMRTLAWTRQYKQSRVLCFESGHDNDTYQDPNFRTFLHQGIQWLA